MKAELGKPQYRIVVELDAPIENCYAAGLDEAAVMYWVTDIKSVVYDHSKASEPYGPGSARRVTLKSGLSVIEEIQETDKPRYLAYRIPSLGTVADRFFSNYRANMSFEALGENRTRLTWVGYFDCKGLQRLAEPLIRRTFRKMITTFALNMQSYVLRDSRQESR